MSNNSNSEHRSKHHSSKHSSATKNRSKGENKEICIDNLFPSNNKSGTKGVKLDIETLFCGTPLNNDPDLTFSSDLLVERINKRRLEKLGWYKNMLKYCHNRIDAADEDQGTDIIFSVVESIPECKEYVPQECLEYISIKLREDDFDTTILTDTTMFITWKYLELRKTERLQNEELSNNSNNKEKVDILNSNLIDTSKKVTKEITLNKSPLLGY